MSKIAVWFLLVSWSLALSPPLAAQPIDDDPYVFSFRSALFPAYFQGGISQSQFGSAVRTELDLSRRVTAQLAGRMPWLNVTGQDSPLHPAGRAGVFIHIEDESEVEPLSGTVYPEDAPAIRGTGPGTDRDLDIPVSQKLGGPRLTLPEKDRSLKAIMRTVQSLRIGYDYVQSVQRARPLASDGSARYSLNRLHIFSAGYGFGTHWNLSAKSGGGTREVGWKRFFVDALFTVEGLTDIEPYEEARESKPTFFPVGVRIGMEGAIAALLRNYDGFGFGYSLELGALPGESGLEGYLFLGLGAELDAGG